jgi:hypothetical protein
VRSLCEHATIDFLPWTGASVIAQVGYGAVLCKLFGFSFEVLRTSTLALGVLADAGVFLLARALGLRLGLAALATVSFALSPLRVNLGFTFMTDLPFTAFAVWASYFYVRGLTTPSLRALLWGSSLAAAATLVRQHGVFIAGAAGIAAFALPSMYAPGKHAALTERFRAAIVCMVLPAIALAAYYAWLHFARAQPEAMARKAAEALQIDPLTILNLGFRAVETLGAALLPIGVVALLATMRMRPRTLVTTSALLAALVAFLAAREGAAMPYLPNLIRDFGVGALTLRDTLFLGMPAPGTVGAAFTWPLTAVATLAAAAILVASAIGCARIREARVRYLLLAGALLAAGSLLHTRYYFDRYLLPILPFAAIACALGVARLQAREPAGTWLAAIVVVLASGWFSVAGTHDYMAWNRARHVALEGLRAEGVAPERIDGGMEFNAWHLAKRVGRSPTDADVVIGQAADRKSWWWVIDDEYVISMHPLARYEIAATAVYPRWLLAGMGTIHVLVRTPTETTPAR